MTTQNILYKYRTWSLNFHRDCLLKNQLYFSAPSDMNDPFDCRVTVDYSLLNTDKKIEKYIEQLIEESLPFLDGYQIDFPSKKKELIARIKNDRSTIQNEYDEKNFLKTNKNYGVLSFSQRWDSILMWTHYSENHKGFCIGFNKEKMTNSNLFGASGNVKYSDSFPQIDPLITILERAIWQTHTKAADWSYEQEYRFLNIIDKPEPLSEDRQVQFSNEFIEEIILGLNIPEDHKTEIEKIAKEKKVPLFKIIKKDRSFLLNKERI